jgi:DNA-binding PadR family transcriptional regulator
MEKEGLLRSRNVVVVDRTRRTYSITAAGERTVAEAKVQLRELAEEVLGMRLS